MNQSDDIRGIFIHGVRGDGHQNAAIGIIAATTDEEDELFDDTKTTLGSFS